MQRIILWEINAISEWGIETFYLVTKNANCGSSSIHLLCVDMIEIANSILLLIIIYHDFLPPPKRGSHVKSDNTHTIITIHPLAHILNICALIFSSCALFTVILTASCNGITPLPRWPPEHGRAVRKNTGTGKNGSVKLIHLHTYVPGLFTLSDLSRIDAQPPPSFVCCLRPPSHHPSSLTSVSLVPDIHLLSSSTPFWPFGTHPFFPHAKTISVLSDLLYSLTPFLCQLSYAPLYS